MSQSALDSENFLEMLSAERGAAANTLESYRRDLDGYLQHLARRGLDASDAGPEDIRSWLEAMSKSGMAASTAARRLSAIRQFHRFLFTEGRRGDDPTATIDSPRQGRALPKVLSEDEVSLMLEVSRSDETPAGLRMTALLLDQQPYAARDEQTAEDRPRNAAHHEQRRRKGQAERR